jgi:hypothetical protein
MQKPTKPTSHSSITAKRAFKKLIPVQIPCKPHVKAFLEERFQLPYKLSLSDWLGIAVYHILRREKKDKYIVADPADYSCSITLLMRPEYMFHKGLTNVSDYTIYKINNLVESVISDIFLDYMESRVKDTTVKEAILCWVEKYDFPDNSFTTYDNLKQKYFRFRRARKRKENL